MTKTYVVIVDHDGCTSVEYKDHSIINETFINYLYEQIVINQYTKVIFIIGSNRQSSFYDKINEQNNMNSNPRTVIPQIIQKLVDKCFINSIACSFMFDMVLTSDVHNNQKPGYNHMTLYKDELKTIFDDKKVIMMIYFMLYINETYNTGLQLIAGLRDSIHILFVDDRGDILDPIYKTIQDLKDYILPQNISFELKGLVVHREWIDLEDNHIKSDENEYTHYLGKEFVKYCIQYLGYSYRTRACKDISKSPDYFIIKGGATTLLDSVQLWHTLVKNYRKGDIFEYQLAQITNFIKQMHLEKFSR